MKRNISAIAVTTVLCIMMGGCGFWMDGTQVYVTPHHEQNLQVGDEVVAVNDHSEMSKILVEQIESGASGGVLKVLQMDDAAARESMNIAVREVEENNPVCAYAVKDITYDVGTNRDATVIAFQINYHRGRSEILRIKQTDTMKEAQSVITGALDSCEASVVLRVSQYESVDLAQLVQDYANYNPDIIMEVPNVSAEVYPESGADRVIAVTFTYQTSREDLRNMREKVEPVFTSAELYVKGASQVSDIYSQLYSFLMRRYDYIIETSITPTYSLLLHGVGDSRAIANVYAAMCREAELDCKTISGTKDGEPRSWNLVRFRGEYYHVDLLECSRLGEFRMCSAAEMGGYVWDYSEYPVN